MNRQMEREIDQLEQMLADGEISQKEFNKEMRELLDSYQAAAEEDAEAAYENTMRDHGYW